MDIGIITRMRGRGVGVWSKCGRILGGVWRLVIRRRSRRSLAHVSAWRWGVKSETMRRYLVGGICRRSLVHAPGSRVISSGGRRWRDVVAVTMRGCGHDGLSRVRCGPRGRVTRARGVGLSRGRAGGDRHLWVV